LILVFLFAASLCVKACFEAFLELGFEKLNQVLKSSKLLIYLSLIGGMPNASNFLVKGAVGIMASVLFHQSEVANWVRSQEQH